MIAPQFYGYEERIKSQIEKEGAKVYLIYENIDRISFFYRFIYVYLKPMKNKVIAQYYKRKIERLPQNIDCIFIIRGSSLTKEVLERIKKKYSGVPLYQYQWDSVESNPNAINIAELCERNFTFDFADSDTYQWRYRPLFFCEDKGIKNREIDISFIGTLHTKRLQIVKQLMEFCKENQYTNFLYLYCNKLIYLKKKYIEHDDKYQGLADGNVKFKSLSLEETNKIYGKSKVVVDYTAEQTGLTMRTIESIGNGCKLITNNKYIQNTDLYYPENILLYTGVSFDIPKTFVEEPCKRLPLEIRKKYMLENWVREIFGEIT